MLESVFDWLQFPSDRNGELEVLPVAYATVTIHYATDIRDEATDLLGAGLRDCVWYANGRVYPDTTPYQRRTLKGRLPAWINASKAVPVLGVDGETAMLVDLFPDNPSLGMDLSVSIDGEVSIQRLAAGRAYESRPPVHFRGFCQGGLVMGLVGPAVYTLGFATGRASCAGLA